MTHLNLVHIIASCMPTFWHLISKISHAKFYTFERLSAAARKYYDSTYLTLKRYLSCATCVRTHAANDKAEVAMRACQNLQCSYIPIRIPQFYGFIYSPIYMYPPLRRHRQTRLSYILYVCML